MSSPFPSRTKSCSESTVAIDRLSVSYETITALDNISLTINKGLTLLLGKNGAGKTTLIESVLGLTVPSAGSVRVRGFDPHRDRPSLANTLAGVLQDGGPYPTAATGEFLTYLASLYLNPRNTDDLLEKFSIPPKQRIKTLSGGQLQRLKCAAAFIGSPEVVLLDEPTAGLDPIARRDLYEVLSHELAGGMTIVVSTHLIEDIDAIPARIIALRSGNLVFDSQRDHIDHRELVSFTARPGLPIEQLNYALPPECETQEISAGRYQIRVAEISGVAVIATVNSWCAQHDTAPTELEVGPESLGRLVYRVIT